MEGTKIIDRVATARVHGAASFAKLIGFEVLKLTQEVVRARIAWSSERLTSGSALHGGALMSLADICGGTIAFLNLPTGAVETATIESKTNFFRPVREGHATATARLLHRGQTTLVIETEVHDDAGHRITKTIQTEAVLYARHDSSGT